MATSILFGYSVEDVDGKLRITIDGAFAECAVRALQEEIKSGRGMWTLSRLSPMRTLGRLMGSHPVNLVRNEAPTSELGRLGTPEPNERLDLEQVFRQGFDQDFSSFEQQMAAFQKSLNELSSELVSAEQSSRTSKATP